MFKGEEEGILEFGKLRTGALGVLIEWQPTVDLVKCELNSDLKN